VLTAEDSLGALVYKQNPDYSREASVQLGSAVYIWLTTDTLKIIADPAMVDTTASGSRDTLNRIELTP